MKIALFGGTFDPVHNGHLLMAEAARDVFSLDRIIFLPTGTPPHKAAPQTSAKHRVAMLRRAVAGNSAFSVSDWEIRQQRTVYSYETLAYFRERWPSAKRYFLIGSDSLAQIRQWRQGTALLKQCSFLTAERPGYPWIRLPISLRQKVRRVPSALIPFASHEIRDRVRHARSIRYQVPESVDRYIRRHRLYQKGH